jgi:hypothetical protein
LQLKCHASEEIIGKSGKNGFLLLQVLPAGCLTDISYLRTGWLSRQHIQEKRNAQNAINGGFPYNCIVAAQQLSLIIFSESDLSIIKWKIRMHRKRIKINRETLNKINIRKI